MTMLRWTQRFLFASGACILIYVAFVLIDAYIHQERDDQLLESLMHDKQTATSVAPAAQGLIGRLQIPRLGIALMVAEGVDPLTLRRGAGHIPGTALPGQPGNSGISAHRDTYFRALRNIKQQDLITITTPLGDFLYRVVSTRVVDPSEYTVLDPGEKQILTLVTCYPFYFIGSAPSRFIVRAERVKNPS